MKVRNFGRDDEFFPGPQHVLGASLQRCLEHGFLTVPAGVDIDLTLPLELPRNRPRGPQISAVLFEDVSHVGDGALHVVGRCLDEERHSPRPIPLIGDLLIGHTRKLARPPLDRALDVVEGHVGGLGRVDSETEAGIEVRIPTSLP